MNKMSLVQKIDTLLSQDVASRNMEGIKEVSPWFRKTSTLFKSLNIETLCNVIKLATLFHIKTDHVICHQGEEGTCFYVLLRGSATVYAKKVQEQDPGNASEPVLMEITNARGYKERTRFGANLCTLYSGRCFGELSVIEKRDRNATVISDEPCVLVKFDDKVYDKHINTGAAEDLLRRSNFVGNHPLFQTLLPYRDLIVENLKLRHYKFNDEIFRQGKKADCVYFVVEGQVELMINPSVDIEVYIKGLPVKRTTVTTVSNKRENDDSDSDEEYLNPFKQLTMSEKRKLRKEKGFHASEQRYQKWSLSLIGTEGILGDVEAILDLPVYTTSAICKEELKLYEIDKSNFIQLLSKKNSETYENLKQAVHEKILFRNNVHEDGLPVFNALLEMFETSQPKDSRKLIMKANNANKQKTKKKVTSHFFNEMSKGRTNNRFRVKENDEFAAGNDSEHGKTRKTGVFASNV